MKNIIKPVFTLVLVVFFSAIVIYFVKKITFPYIVKQEIDQQNKAFELVLPGYTSGDEITFNPDGGEKFKYRVGTKSVDGIEKKAFIFISVNYGFNSDIKSIVGVDEEYRILGISIIQQTETPGYGARLTENPHKEFIWGVIQGRNFSREELTEQLFQEQFRGIDLNNKIKILNNGIRSKVSREELLHQNAITVTTGATVTAKAIVDGLKDSLIKLKKARLIFDQNVINELNKEDAK